jgi:hypothetical protein
MGFNLRGYVLDKPRIGTANSPFTSTPDNYVYDPVAYAAAYPSGVESSPRADYMVFVEAVDGNLPVARFAWTKNEGAVTGGTQVPFQRFDYAGATQRFQPLPGGPLDVASAPLGPNSNTSRIGVLKPTLTNLSAFPIRVSVGTGSGTTFAVTLVANDGAFGSPPAGAVELSLATGNLNWHTADLTTYAGQAVRFQRQSFFPYRDSNGRMGSASSALLLNPVPATGQFPLLRFGSGLYLTTIEVPSESSFTTPSSGTVQWARDTGRLHFNPADVTSNVSRSVYYDGVCLRRGLALSQQSLGGMPSGYTSLTMTSAPPVGGDLVFKVAGKQFAQVMDVTSFSDSTGQQGVVQILRSGATAQVRFSLADRTAYAGQTVTVTNGDLPVEHGVALRFFRDPVNLDGSDAALKDVTSIYPVTNANLASPIIAQPQVFLPALPIDQTGYTINVHVEQGSGSFVGTLPRLDVGVPPVGYGYTLDLDNRQLQYARRRSGVLVPTVRSTGASSLPDPLVNDTNISLELETAPGSGVYAPLALGSDALFEPLSGTVSFTTTSGTLVTQGTGASTLNGILTAPGGDFIVAGVQVGDLVLVSGSAAEGLYTVQSVPSATTLGLDVTGPNAGPFSYEIRRGREVLADRYFKEVVLADPSTKVEQIRSLGAPTNSPRLFVSTDAAARARFRFDRTTFSSSVALVANDSLFTDPALLTAGRVEISLSTGHLNLSDADIAAYATIYSVVLLRQAIDYRLTPPLGLVTYTSRTLAWDEGLITYTPLAADGTELPTTVEPATFLVRKEVTQSHPTPTAVLRFNTTGRQVASNPAPAVFRGGRPQQLDTQCVVNTSKSTITFLPDNQVTDALPHGDTIGPNERVYIDYNVLEALGGEGTTSVLQAPMSVAQIAIQAGENSFAIRGNWVSYFPANYMLRIEAEEVYILSGADYDAQSNTTLVRIAVPQEFQTDFTNPRIYVSSGPVPYVSTYASPSYYVTEAAPFDPIPRGGNRLVLSGDRTASYRAGTIVIVSDAAHSFMAFYEVAGAAYDGSSKTVITFTKTFSTQAAFGAQTLRYSVRPILGSATASLVTSRSPVLAQPFTLYRRVAGQPGKILGAPPSADYTIDDSGKVTFSAPLSPNEELGILYTGHTVIEAGRTLRAAYTHLIVPDASNGLLDQILQIDYSLYSPDTFYYRVETFTNYRGELSQQYEAEAKAGSPSGGPVTSNSSQTPLYSQGRSSLFFDEGKYANEDIVARSSLVFYNDVVNYLEDYLQDVDGRVVGNRSGRFRFDGSLTNPSVTTLQAATNQIDDAVKVSDAPYQIHFAFPSFSVTSLGTYQTLYRPSALSRFYPTFRHAYGVVAPAANTGDPVLDLGAKNVSSVASVRTRPAFAQITSMAQVGDVTLYVDNAEGSATFARPPFKGTMKCVVQAQDGTYVVPVGAEIVLSVVTATTLALTAPLGVSIPAGATIYRSPADDSLASGGNQPTVDDNLHYTPTSYGMDPNGGQLLYVKAYPPLDGSVPLIPKELLVKQLPAGQALSLDVSYFNALSAPARPPVLDGLTTDDDGEMTLPLLSPSFDCEVPPFGPGHLSTELALIRTSGPVGALRAVTQAPFVGAGSLDVTRTVITRASGIFVAGLLPRVNDLVRILTGLNGATEYRRVTTSSPTSVTVDVPFTSQDTGFQFVVGYSPSTQPAGTGTLLGNTLTDLTASFMSTVVVGQTLVISSGLRRQVTAVDSATVIHFSGGTLSGVLTYRIDNSLVSFGNVSGSYADTLAQALQGELEVLSTNVPPKPHNEQAALSQALDEAFTDIVSGAGSASGSTLTDAGATFITSGVKTTDLLYIRSGAARGVYGITAVPSETTLTLSAPFGGSGAASYRVVSSFGLGLSGATDIFTQLAAVDDFIPPTQTFAALVATPVPVVKLPGVTLDTDAYAASWLTTDLDAREVAVTARSVSLSDGTSGPTAIIRNVLSASEKLYDKRYVWIDARINLATGILTRKAQAVSNRMSAQTDMINQLTKLLSVQ